MIIVLDGNASFTVPIVDLKGDSATASLCRGHACEGQVSVPLRLLFRISRGVEYRMHLVIAEADIQPIEACHIDEGWKHVVVSPHLEVPIRVRRISRGIVAGPNRATGNPGNRIDE